MDWLKKLENVKKFYQEPGFVLPEPGPTEQEGTQWPETYGWDFMAPKSAGPREGSTGSELVDAITERLVPDLGVSYKSPKGWSIGAGPWLGESDPSIGFQFRKEFDKGGMVKMLNYLETLPKGTKITIPQLIEIAKKKKIKITGSSLNNLLTNIDGKQIAGSGNEVYQFGKERRDQVKNILKNVTVEKAPTGTRSGTQMTVKRRNKANKIAKILFEKGEISSPNYADIKFQSKDYYKINARMDREIIKKKDGTLDFKDESKKPLRSDQQAKLKKRFPEADFSKGKYGFPVDSPEEQYAKKYFKQGYKETLKEGLTPKQIKDIKERFPQIPEKDWNFLTKDNPKGFKYGLAGTGKGGKYRGMNNRIAGYLEGKTWFDRFAPGLNGNSQNYLLTSFERIAEHEDKLKPSQRTYKRIKNKDGKIIGFQDNTPTGKGKKYYMVGYKAQGGLPITQHPGYAKGVEITKYVEATKGMKIGGARFNDLISESMKTKPGGFGVTPWERHHIYGTAKTGFGGMPGEIMLLTRDQNRAVEGVRKAYYRGVDSRYGKPLTWEQADRELKKIGAALDLDGRVAGVEMSPEKTITRAGKAAGISGKEIKTLLKQLCNKGKAQGGRIGMKVAGTPTVACGANRFKQVFQNPAKGTQAERQLVGQIVKRGGTTAGRRLLYTLGPAGVGIDAMIEGAMWGDDVLKGSSGEQAWKDNWLSYLDPSAYTGGLKVSGDRYNETEIAKKYKGDTAKFYNLAHAIEDKYRLENKLRINEESDVEGYGVTLSPSQQLRLEAVNTIINNHGGEERVLGLIKEDSPLFNAAQISSEKFEEVGPGKDWDRKLLAKGPQAQRIRDDQRQQQMDTYATYDQFITPQQYQGMDLEEQTQVAPYVVPQANLAEQAGLKEFYKIPAAHDLSEYRYKDTGMSLLDEYNQRKKWEMLLNTKGMRGTQDTRYADGGIANVRRPHAIAPESGPAPQGEGLSYILNSVKEW